MIPATHDEIEQIYLAAELSGSRSVCVTACHSREGVTAIASALTERYLLAGHKTLYVDLNLFHPAFQNIDMLPSDAESELVTGSLIEHRETQQLFTGVSVPAARSQQMAYKDPNKLKTAVTNWLSEFDRVIVDTSPLLNVNKNNIPAQSVASACDKTILIVLGGSTTSAQLNKAMAKLNQPGIELLGTVLNAKEQPTLKQELIREIQRLRWLPESWRAKAIKTVCRIDLLSTYA
jgi:Mrp family chromosome partitioning ATPase